MKPLSLFVLLLLPAMSVAAPVPKPGGKPITAATAALVKSAAEVERRSHRLFAGPDGEWITFDYNGVPEALDDKFKPLRALTDKKPVTDYQVSKDGKHVAWLERNAKAYTLSTGGKTVQIEIGEHAGYAAFSPDGKLFAVGDTFWSPAAEGAGQSVTHLFDLTGKKLRTLDKTGPGSVHPVFSPDGKTLAVGNRNYETQLFDVATGKLLHKLDRKMTQEIAFSPDGKKLAAGYVDGTVGIWEVATGKQLHLEKSGCLEIYSVDWNPKGDVLATSGRGGKAVLWESDKMAKLAELEAGFWVIQVRFSPDGTRLVTSSAADHSAKTERKLQAWSVEGR